MLKDHLGQLVKARYLKEFVVDSGSRGTSQGTQQRGNPLPPPLGVIKVIHATPRGPIITSKGVLIVEPTGNCAGEQSPMKKMKIEWKAIAFGNEDLKGTIQPHDDALVVTAQIGGFLVKRVMVDQGSGADMMHPDLFKGLRLRN